MKAGLRPRIAAVGAAAILGVAGVAAAFMRSGEREVDPLAAAGWSVGAITVTPSPSGARVTAEVTNRTDRLREAVFTIVISARDSGERLAVVQGYAPGMGPGETRRVDFPGTEDFLGTGGPYRFTVEVSGSMPR